MSEPITWTNTTVKLGDLQPWERNQRKSSKKQAQKMLESWERFGQVQTIAVGPGLEVYDGHQRLSALLAVHGKTYSVDARQASRELSEAEREQLVITLHTGATGQWDWTELANWDATSLQEWGFDQDALSQWNTDAASLALLLESEKAELVDVEPQIDRADELREKWGVETGQLWQLGAHRLICGDCTDPAVVDRVMGGERADFVFADPPYGVNIVATNGYVGGGEGPDGMIPFGGVKNRKRGFVGGGEGDSLRHGHHAIEERTAKRLGSVGGAKPFGSADVRGTDGASNVVAVGKYAPVIGDETTETAIRSVRFFLEMWPDAVQVWWGANYYSEVLSPSACWLVWNKETTGYFADCELAWTNQDRAAKLFTHKWNGMLRDSERERRMHPTQKPAALAQWAFTELGNDGQIIFDPFCGCGPTIVAGESCGRRVRAVEMSEDYCAVILQRFFDLTGVMPTLAA